MWLNSFGISISVLREEYKMIEPKDELSNSEGYDWIGSGRGLKMKSNLVEKRIKRLVLVADEQRAMYKWVEGESTPN